MAFTYHTHTSSVCRPAARLPCNNATSHPHSRSNTTITTFNFSSLSLCHIALLERTFQRHYRHAMLTAKKDDVVIVQPLNSFHHAVRVVRALYPQACMGAGIKRSGASIIVEPQDCPRTYHNTGVQTLPPPNIETYQLIHGLQPLRKDFRRSIGIAAIGRYEKDPRLNPCELIYGAAYDAPPVARQAVYVDSCFQTASCEVSKIALARAKAKASMTVSKYRTAASQAGYDILAEIKDKSIIHSEQYPFKGRFDSDGNLLNGVSLASRVPNVYGRLSSSVHVEKQLQTHKAASSRQQRSIITEHVYTSASDQASCPLPTQSLDLPAQVISHDSHMLQHQIRSLAPTCRNSALDPSLEIQNQDGDVGSYAAEYVVFSAGDAAEPCALMLVAAPASASLKRRWEGEGNNVTPTKRCRQSKPKDSPGLSGSIGSLSSSPTPRPQSASQAAPGTLIAGTSPARSQSPRVKGTRPGNLRIKHSLRGFDARGIVEDAYPTIQSETDQVVDDQAHDSISFSLKLSDKETNIPAKHRNDNQLPKAHKDEKNAVRNDIMLLMASPLSEYDCGKMVSSSAEVELGGRQLSPHVNTRPPHSRSEKAPADLQHDVPEVAILESFHEHQDNSRPVSSAHDGPQFCKGIQHETNSNNRILSKSISPNSSQSFDKRSSPSKFNTSGRTSSSCVETRYTSRITRAPRQAFTPYIPPGKRANVQGTEVRKTQKRTTRRGDFGTRG
jgi:hypothetical protein